MNFRTTAVIFVIAILMGFGTPLKAGAFTGHQYSGQAKISMKQARHIAKKQVMGGRIIKEELEKEWGGSGLRYSFDILHQGTVHEVGIDAKTGKVLENSLENKEGKGSEKD